MFAGPPDLKSRVGNIVLAGMIVVLVFDAIGSLASRELGFSYAFLVPGSVLIYGTVAALVAQRRDIAVGVLAAIALVLIDLTLGWVVSWIIGPGRPAGGFTVMTVVGAVMTGFVLAGLAGAVGSWIGTRFLRRA